MYLFADEQYIATQQRESSCFCWRVSLFRGSVGNTIKIRRVLLHQDNKCSDATDCNLNGEYNDGACRCENVDGVSFSSFEVFFETVWRNLTQIWISTSSCTVLWKVRSSKLNVSFEVAWRDLLIFWLSTICVAIARVSKQCWHEWCVFSSGFLTWSFVLLFPTVSLKDSCRVIKGGV